MNIQQYTLLDFLLEVTGLDSDRVTQYLTTTDGYVLRVDGIPARLTDSLPKRPAGVLIRAGYHLYYVTTDSDGDLAYIRLTTDRIPGITAAPTAESDTEYYDA